MQHQKREERFSRGCGGNRRRVLYMSIIKQHNQPRVKESPPSILRLIHTLDNIDNLVQDSLLVQHRVLQNVEIDLKLTLAKEKTRDY